MTGTAHHILQNEKTIKTIKTRGAADFDFPQPLIWWYCMKKKILGGTIIFCIVCFIGMVFFGKNLETNPLTVGEMRYAFSSEDLSSGDGRITYLYFGDQSIIYQVPQGDVPNYYRYYIEDQKNVYLGDIPNYYIGTNNVAELGNKIYFFAGILTESEIVNKLFYVDLENNEFGECSEYEDQSVAGITGYSYNDCIVSLKNFLNEDESIQTFFDFYNPKTDQWTTYNKELWRSYDEEGTALYLLYATNENLYSVEDKYNDKGEMTRSLIIYDDNMNQEKQYNLSGDILGFMSNGRVNEMSANTSIIYLKNTSNYGFIGRLQEGRIETLINEERYLEKVDGDTTICEKGNLFFIRRSNILYFYDEEKYTLSAITLDMNEKESLRSVFVDGEYILLVCYVEDDDGSTVSDQIYAIPVTDLIVP